MQTCPYTLVNFVISSPEKRPESALVSKLATEKIGFLPNVCLPEEDAEQLTQVHVVWSLLKAQPTAVVQIHGKLCWETLGKGINTVELYECYIK